jgi:hypothetical protein
MVRIFGSAAPRRRAVLALVSVAARVLSLGVYSAQAASLPGSTFEIDTDANLIVNTPGNLDWVPVTQVRQADEPSGALDDSFGQGTKEDTAVPTVVNGSIPPQKSDLLNFGLYLETTASGARFLNLYWHRVQEPNGTTNMDFEFNKSLTPSANGVTPIRSAGDLLIQYDLAQGGTNPQLFLSRWVGSGAGSLCEASNSTPCWGARVNLSASGDAIGSINTSAIPAAQSDGLGNISPRTFGEASLDFDALGGGSGCTTFGSAYLKSRSSDSFTAALKDFIKPTATNITNCGTVNIHKQDDAGAPLASATFVLFTDNAPVDGAPPHGANDTANATLTCTTDATGNCSITSVPFGNYWAVETVTPPNHTTAADQSFSITQATPNQTISLTFVDVRQTGAILVTKTRKHAADGPGPHPHAGVNFTVAGVTKATDANGQACFDGLLPGAYTVHETVPAGYHVVANDKSVTVDNAATCAATPYAGETVSFSNTPLTNFTVSVDSQVDGGTASTIDCTVTSGSTGANGDGSATASDLEPGTYTCTIVIDP